MDELESLVNVSLADPEMELEIRLGKIAFGRFQTDVPAPLWNRVKVRLESCKKWTAKDVLSFTDEYFGDVRRRTFSDGRVEIARKERIVVHDVPVPERPMDLRVSLSKEHRLESIGDSAHASRRDSKTRHRFVHKDLWAFELTEVEGLKDIDSECSARYQIEIEFLPSARARTYPCKYLGDYGKLLAQDVLGMIS